MNERAYLILLDFFSEIDAMWQEPVYTSPERKEAVLGKTKRAWQKTKKQLQGLASDGRK